MADTKVSKGKEITYNMLLSAASLTKSSKESSDSYLQRVTHLHLHAKKISKIASLEICTNLKVLYLYDNQISRIENLEIPNLQYLYLQNNAIVDIPQLNLPSLSKLFLDDNEISYVTGLDKCTRLEELRIPNQRRPSPNPLIFDPDVLYSISISLQVLDVSGNGIYILEPFSSLHNLRKFFSENNLVESIYEIETVVSLPYLEELSFIGCPCYDMRTYRDFTIGASADSLKVLDKVPVLRHQQLAIRGLTEQRKRNGQNMASMTEGKIVS